MDYLARFSLNYSSFDANRGRRNVEESCYRIFPANNQVAALDTANTMVGEIARELRDRRMSQVSVTLERFFQLNEIRLR